jgi:hypothetical protein
MTMSGPSGGGGVSLDDILVMLFGSNFSGLSTAPAAGVGYVMTQSDTGTQSG